VWDHILTYALLLKEARARSSGVCHSVRSSLGKEPGTRIESVSTMADVERRKGPSMSKRSMAQRTLRARRSSGPKRKSVDHSVR
jgi:hypothetical protein